MATKTTRIVMLSLVITALLLTAVSTFAAPIARADAGDYCNTQSVCGWCHSSVCPGGYGILYYGWIEQCYHADGTRFSVDYGCNYSLAA